ncbi:hypothetical protein [Blastococcus brunescens]|uniref:NADH:flavin oxidoreductase/NADH oxidase N-terminal domain-containing protein n=1 Tax=Blastococcus brunescens TaxID=1564165 RepID=A0ABZ1AXZ7_9ACTN|nr:hypothetical protein [Blastococcus sp. BMG 8361]WRL63446.1 hypothetical protein U6N30_27580 [Blastococcus sp. BMG 8361]
MSTPALLSPLALRGVTLPNRLVVAPMCQYSVTDGFVGDYHLAHLGRFALGGFGLVVVEATGVTPEGRISHGDTGLWSDEHVPGMARVVDFLHAHGSKAGIQLAHAGAKASSKRPWDGEGPVTPENAQPGEEPWPTVSASAVPVGPGWPIPHALTVEELGDVRNAFVAAARRSLDAGFDVVEVHAAHGYLLNQFLSPLTNRRADAYGGSRDGRMRFPLEVVEAVRAAWPDDRPLFVRVSSVDGSRDGVTLEDTVAFARELKARGWTSSTPPAAVSAADGTIPSATATRSRTRPGSARRRTSPPWPWGSSSTPGRPRRSSSRVSPTWWPSRARRRTTRTSPRGRRSSSPGTTTSSRCRPVPGSPRASGC